MSKQADPSFPNVVAIVQIRMGSTRLPKKAMLKVLDRPLLGYLADRLEEVPALNSFCFATTKTEEDDVIETFCKENKYVCFRGSSENVLKRYYDAAVFCSADIIVRITADCPLLDPMVTNRVIQFYLEHLGEFDYVSNVQERSFPRGLDTEVFSMEALKEVYSKVVDKSEQEHVTLHIHRNMDKFNIGSLLHEENLSYHRWTVDTKKDFELIKLIIESIIKQKKPFDMESILELFQEHPEWIEINCDIKQKEE
jgi:spore coat polysaccharide biosynthesis protein SpsF